MQYFKACKYTKTGRVGKDLMVSGSFDISGTSAKVVDNKTTGEVRCVMAKLYTNDQNDEDGPSHLVFLSREFILAAYNRLKEAESRLASV